MSTIHGPFLKVGCLHYSKQEDLLEEKYVDIRRERQKKMVQHIDIDESTGLLHLVGSLRRTKQWSIQGGDADNITA